MPLLLKSAPKFITMLDVKKLTMFFFWQFHGFRAHTQIVLIHFVLIIVCVVENGSVSWFYRWLLHFPNIIYWRDGLFSIIYSWLLVINQLTIFGWIYFWAFCLDDASQGIKLGYPCYYWTAFFFLIFFNFLFFKF